VVATGATVDLVEEKSTSIKCSDCLLPLAPQLI
jgi:hypothetical protein